MLKKEFRSERHTNIKKALSKGHFLTAGKAATAKYNRNTQNTKHNNKNGALDNDGRF